METVIVGARGSKLAQLMVQELITHLSGCPVVRFKARSVMTALRPDVEVVPIRGNVPPRLAKVKAGLDAVILAASGLRRLGLDDAITELLDPALFPPSPGQGALAVQVRATDRELLEMLNAFGDPDADAAVRAERALLGELHGGCSVPVGAYATRSGGVLTLSAQVTSLDGRQKVTGTVTGSSPETTGTDLAAVLRDRGADAILNQVRQPAAR
jgi:hydroxymethylbilane synthase